MVIRGYGWLQVVMIDDGVGAGGHGLLRVVMKFVFKQHQNFQNFTTKQ